MPYFVKKPIPIEAWPFEGDAHTRGVCTCGDLCPHVHTMHGNQMVFLAKGDYITPEPDGVHHYPIKASYMREHYDEVAP